MVTGGIRSGKSVFAEKLCSHNKRKVIYVATGVIVDEEMEERIQLHQQRRPADWKVVEEPLLLADVFKQGEEGVIYLLDCLSTWVSNHLLAHGAEGMDRTERGLWLQCLQEDVEALITSLSGKEVVIVTSEVGMGGVSSYEMGRAFQDGLGYVNQRFTEIADEVWLMTAGAPLKLKRKDGEGRKKKEVKKEWASFLSAWSFLTRIPLPFRQEEDRSSWQGSIRYYPVIGLVVGLIVALFDQLVAVYFPPLVRAVLDVGVWVWLTGGLHLDGLMDTADGWGANQGREMTLTIMKDSRVGAMGVLAALFILALKGATLASLGMTPVVALLTSTIMARSAAVYAVYFWPYVRRSDGIASGLSAGLSRKTMTVITVGTGSWCALWFGWFGLLMWVLVAVVVFSFAALVMKKLGGMTGDTYGALIELVEVVVLVLLLLQVGG
ncbi:bifunctional adenosylcobinamide kinase/adenosylcobinamide-phosphate guanylyltransferase [Mechercharimyces sp. CAU 1602]|uniref:bifunctional adenosylcobinamide kinase/adenosylcobinamide-phosphate guanylyltransferase n=1 Tax=Mechercharimyces sp. CAU 1602 TaxID=2973933 RepID=UPI002163CF1C|nr:bifunctional adenosylcobinamide kinase/adenosylcobinamide-phosphate guanylyltransferase [Mechercharimyces sp. CAU 1602]MCS1351854.1 bifunctional adenosylcobinamide kinase/adenosylcobinamide-phosphate guanylyltransferase [Mechercharimyces sp. CAU 1602]